MSSNNKLKLFSAVGRCQPCRMLQTTLDKDFPKWKDYIEYIDVDDTLSEDNYTLANKLHIMGLPSITDENTILFKGFKSDTVDKLKQLCLIKE